MDTKEKILMGMLELIWDVSLEKASIGTLARRIKVSPGNIYYYFKDKNEILNTLYYHCLDMVIEAVEPYAYEKLPDRKKETVKNYLHSFIKKFLNYYRENPLILNYMVTAKSSSYLSDDIKKIMYNKIDAYGIFFEDMKRNKVTKNVSIEITILYMISIMYEFAKQEILLKNITFSDENEEEMFELIWSGLSF
ncbi:MAG: TetR/AcrR family transcriptional regulator [Sebaldella sp.]|nr:TetR/AcrR family transcriptional regulator [Sebaldella sp.]